MAKSTYEVIILETLAKAITVEAENRWEAKDIVRKDYENGKYILGWEDFSYVEFETSKL